MLEGTSTNCISSQVCMQYTSFMAITHMPFSAHTNLSYHHHHPSFTFYEETAAALLFFFLLMS